MLLRNPTKISTRLGNNLSIGKKARLFQNGENPQTLIGSKMRLILKLTR